MSAQLSKVLRLYAVGCDALLEFSGHGAAPLRAEEAAPLEEMIASSDQLNAWNGVDGVTSVSEKVSSASHWSTLGLR